MNPATMATRGNDKHCVVVARGGRRGPAQSSRKHPRADQGRLCSEPIEHPQTLHYPGAN